MLKLNNYDRRDACEICGKSQDMGSLVVLPIYTLTHLASLYRQQRDMSPLWNTPLWQHYYKTFTPTCVLCEKCTNYFWMRNLNIPVDERRFRRLKKEEKVAIDFIQESDYPSVPLDNPTQKL